MNSQSPVLNAAFHALSDPTRRAVIQQLLAGPAPVKTLAEPFAIGLPSFMKHLRVLEDCGLIMSRKSGRVRTCRLRPERLAAAESWLTEQLAVWERRADRLTAYAESLTQHEVAE